MKRTTLPDLAIFACIVICTCFSRSAAAAGLDLEFAENGIVITDFGIGNDEAYDLAVQPDGKIVVAGFSFNGAVKNIAVARYLPDGTLDTEFNHGGVATFSLGTGDSVAKAVELQDDGKIVLVGSTVDDDADIAVLRLTEDGYFDSPFGYGGHLLINMPGSEDGTGLQIGADGSLYVAGTSQDGESSAAVVAKIDPAGVLEEAFGEGGVAVVGRDDNLTANDLLLLDEGQLLVTSSADNGAVVSPELFRLSIDGFLDPSFGTEGQVNLDFGGSDAELYNLIVLPEGGLAAVGYLDNGSYRNPLVVQLDIDGGLDTAFNDTGILSTDLGSDAVAYATAGLADGTLAVTGYRLTSTGRDLVLLQTAGGGGQASAGLQLAEGAASPEESDAAAEYVLTDVDQYDDESRAVSIMPDGTILTAGYTDNGTDSDFVLARYSSGATEGNARQASGGNSGGEVTGNFLIQTLQPTSVTRNSAATGGSISERVSSQNCEWYCTTACAGSEDETCYETCYADCLPEELTVVSRGVVYGIVQYPVYRPDGSGDDSDGEGDVSPAPLSFLEDSSFESYEMVRSGQTSDGSGIGVYGSDIFDITPDTFYYARAYAVLSDETVIYGNQVTFRTDDACFVATAAFGSLLDEHVMVLRQFRDRYMKTTELGRSLITLYYTYSPPLADLIRESRVLKSVVRLILIPLVGLCYLVLHSYIPVLAGLMLVSAIFVVPVMLWPRRIQLNNDESESDEKCSVEKTVER